MSDPKKPEATKLPAKAGKTAQRTTLSTLERGLSTLEYIAKHPREATAKVIATELGMNRASCYHLLRTLIAEGYIVKVDGGAYDVAQRGASLGNALRNQFLPAPELSAVLSRLHMKTRETVYISGWHHGSIAMQQFIGGEGPLVVARLDIGFTADMHARASCKSMLAHVDMEIITKMFLGLPLRAITRNTITTFDQLVEDLAVTKRRGYAIDDEEFNEGVTCVSAPFFEPGGGPAGSYTVSIATSSAPQRLMAIACDVVEAGKFATRILASRSSEGPQPTASAQEEEQR